MTQNRLGLARLVRGTSSSRIIAALAFCLALSFSAPALAASFNPANVISDANMRDYTSMSAAGVQAFLDSKPGVLKSLSFPRHDGGPSAKASVIIWEASQAYHINPKVLLTMLQKEQSLLTRTTLVTSPNATLDWAVGMGCPDSSPRLQQYKGFGNQLWYAAQRLDGYGTTSSSIRPLWTPGLIYTVAGVRLSLANISTYKLYVYNPSIGAKVPYGDLSGQSCSGNANFWKIYNSSFGDPLVTSATYRPRARVYRKTQLWNATARTKRKPSPGKGGIVIVTGPVVKLKGRKYVPVTWGGNRVGGWVRLDDIRWL
jgi:hypothetical protein